MARLAERMGWTGPFSLMEAVAAVQSIPYGRTTSPTAAGVIAEWKGSCSTKHTLLAAVLTEGWPDTEPRLVHRVYRLWPSRAAELLGAEAASRVPVEGLVDVHRFSIIRLQGADVVLDVTFPGAPAWSGYSSMAVQCGSGSDFPVKDDPGGEKRRLEARFCDPAVREPFIAALALCHASNLDAELTPDLDKARP